MNGIAKGNSAANDAPCYVCGAVLGEHAYVGEWCPRVCADGMRAGFLGTRFTPLPAVAPEPNGTDWDGFLRPGERDEWEPEVDEL